MSTRSLMVKQFTEESLEQTLPTHPRRFSRQEVLFICRMISEEVLELLTTVLDPNEDVKELLLKVVKDCSLPVPFDTTSNDNVVIAAQVDAFVDINYYCENAAAKAGMNVEDVFNVVHEANMNKRFPDCTFHRNDIGKVIKPPDWKEGDVVGVVNQWQANGTW
jgi:predicted HAD superfamily Cof-like phosphohydrolase